MNPIEFLALMTVFSSLGAFICSYFKGKTWRKLSEILLILAFMSVIPMIFMIFGGTRGLRLKTPTFTAGSLLSGALETP
jgi:4-hydroxybenzoate polyprenyltransferase